MGKPIDRPSVALILLLQICGNFHIQFFKYIVFSLKTISPWQGEKKITCNYFSLINANSLILLIVDASTLSLGPSKKKGGSNTHLETI